MSIRPSEVPKTQDARFKFLRCLSEVELYTICVDLVAKLRTGAKPVEDYVSQNELSWAMWKWDSSLLSPKIDLPTLFQFVNQGTWLSTQQEHVEWEQIMLALGLILRDIHHLHFINHSTDDSTSWNTTGHVAEDVKTFLDIRLVLHRMSNAIWQCLDQAKLGIRLSTRGSACILVIHCNFFSHPHNHLQSPRPSMRTKVPEKPPPCKG